MGCITYLRTRDPGSIVSKGIEVPLQGAEGHELHPLPRRCKALPGCLELTIRCCRPAYGHQPSVHCRPSCRRTAQSSINQSSNQSPINQSNKQSTNQPINQSTALCALQDPAAGRLHSHQEINQILNMCLPLGSGTYSLSSFLYRLRIMHVLGRQRIRHATHSCC